MAKGKGELLEITCPCCDAILQVDTRLKAVIRHKEREKAPVIEDLKVAVEKLKGEEARRAEMFQKSFNEHKTHGQVLERKFDELLRQAKDEPVAPPPKRPFDFD